MIIVDVETGGLVPWENPLLSIGAVDFNNPQTRFYAECKPRPFSSCTKEALIINGIDITKENINCDTMLIQFFDWVNNYTTGDLTLAGENPSFDRDFINYNASLYKLKSPFGHRTVDLHSLYYARCTLLDLVPYDDERKNKLNADTIYNMLGMPSEPRPHIAINGALWEAEAFHRIIYGKPGVFIKNEN